MFGNTISWPSPEKLESKINKLLTANLNRNASSSSSSSSGSISQIQLTDNQTEFWTRFVEATDQALASITNSHELNHPSVPKTVLELLTHETLRGRIESGNGFSYLVYAYDGHTRAAKSEDAEEMTYRGFLSPFSENQRVPRKPSYSWFSANPMQNFPPEKMTQLSEGDYDSFLTSVSKGMEPLANHELLNSHENLRFALTLLSESPLKDVVTKSKAVSFLVFSHYGEFGDGALMSSEDSASDSFGDASAEGTRTPFLQRSPSTPSSRSNMVRSTARSKGTGDQYSGGGIPSRTRQITELTDKVKQMNESQKQLEAYLELQAKAEEERRVAKETAKAERRAEENLAIAKLTQAVADQTALLEQQAKAKEERKLEKAATKAQRREEKNLAITKLTQAVAEQTAFLQQQAKAKEERRLEKANTAKAEKAVEAERREKEAAAEKALAERIAALTESDRHLGGKIDTFGGTLTETRGHINKKIDAHATALKETEAVLGAKMDAQGKVLAETEGRLGSKFDARVTAPNGGELSEQILAFSQKLDLMHAQMIRIIGHDDRVDQKSSSSSSSSSSIPPMLSEDSLPAAASLASLQGQIAALTEEFTNIKATMALIATSERLEEIAHEVTVLRGEKSIHSEPPLDTSSSSSNRRGTARAPAPVMSHDATPASLESIQEKLNALLTIARRLQEDKGCAIM